MPLLPLLPAAISVYLMHAGATPPAQPAAKPAPAQPAVAPPRAPAEFKTADELLIALETADRDLRTLTANIRYTREFGSIEGNETQVWDGKLYYSGDLKREAPGAAPEPAARRAQGDRPPPAPPARRGFAVVFEKCILDGRERQERRDFVFDGEWLVERLHKERQMIRRRVVPPGEIADPLRLGQGPFPIPIGQKREDIIRRFEVTLVPPEDGWEGGVLPQGLRGSHQIRLVPKPGTDEAREFQEVRLWYQRIPMTDGGTRLLPRMARTQNFDGASAEVFLTDLQPNQAVPPGVFDTAAPPAGEAWDVDTRELRGGFDNDKERRR